MTNEERYLPLVALAFKNHGLDSAFGCALVRQESNWNPAARSNMRGDLLRGGAYGLAQVTMRTAEAMGYHLTEAQLLDPAINVSLAAELCHQNSGRVHKISPHYYGDLASLYNSGKVLERAPYSTSTSYVPRVLTFMEMYRNKGVK